MTSNSIGPCITIPTRITSRGKTLIDNILINGMSTNLIAGNITASISDHLPQFVFIPSKKHKLTHENNSMKRNYKTFNEESFLNDLRSTPWSEVIDPVNKNDVRITPPVILL